MIEALMLKIAALSLLLMLGQTPNLPEDFRAQAETVANQALAYSEAQLNAPVSEQPTTPVSPTPPAQTTEQPITNNPAPMPETPVSQARIEIVSPIPGKGLGRTYTANDYSINPDGTLAAGSVEPNESNSIDIGAIVYDDAGIATKLPQLTITATDGRQNRTLNGTGAVMAVYVDGQKRQVPVYHFHYEFRSTGEHTITFSAVGKEASATIVVQ